ncbi:shikimate kinase AroK [Salinisphaera hydrothermalis]|uniref:Shikimate kinase n=1 Tax=Salinisphaera hydrothermalis (strain C41B8) TaxID=1304275 RepID=A0A084IRC7_SALHC|nr:shikimate kinase AroK [Salinisphaera hydrothermalis]KEZ79261.1 shikimate kinase I [Salinisphaera hydrothermalis C41B8]
MAANPNIYLIGPMGAGKTTVGRRIAELKGMTFVDSDQEVEKRTGVDISFIFDMEGEEGFRKRERDMIAELSEQPNTVMATGGGAVLDPSTRDLLSARGVVVYLETSLEQQLARTRKSNSRPLLAGSDDLEATLTELMEIRDPLYRSIADIVVTTGDQQARKLAREIVEQLEAIGTA